MTFEQAQSKLDILKVHLARLDEIPQSTFEEFSSDFRNVGAALYLLQTSIQALIDLGSYLVAQGSLAAPRTSHEVFERLEQAGHLPSDVARRMAPIIGFRNRVVHLYDRIDERRLYEILTVHRRDLIELLDLLLAAAEKQAD